MKDGRMRDGHMRDAGHPDYLRRGVLYFLRGSKHASVLVCSLASLRNHWQGPVMLACGDDEAIDLAQKIASDSRLCENFSFHKFIGDDAASTGKKHGSAYATKTLLPQVGAVITGWEQTLFLDADTLVVGPLDELWPRHNGEVVLTQFCDWVSTGTRIAGRLEKWRGVAPEYVERMVGREFPAINTGVMAWCEDGGDFAAQWREMCLRNVSFICDELACQLVFPDHDVRVLNDRFNCSPVYSLIPDATAHQDDVRIWHGHGGKFAKKDSGWAIWEPYYRAALELNLAGIRDWSPGGDKNLRERLDALTARAV
jgi:hypothetical protein